jgi:hypothetical protein
VSTVRHWRLRRRRPIADRLPDAIIVRSNGLVETRERVRIALDRMLGPSDRPPLTRIVAVSALAAASGLTVAALMPKTLSSFELTAPDERYTMVIGVGWAIAAVGVAGSVALTPPLRRHLVLPLRVAEPRFRPDPPLR